MQDRLNQKFNLKKKACHWVDKKFKYYLNKSCVYRKKQEKKERKENNATVLKNPIAFRYSRNITK